MNALKDSEKESQPLPLLVRVIYKAELHYDFDPNEKLKKDSSIRTGIENEFEVNGGADYEWIVTCPYCKINLGSYNEDFSFLKIKEHRLEENETAICKNCSETINLDKSEIIKLNLNPFSGILTEDQWFVYSLRRISEKPYRIIARIKETSESNIRDLYMKAKRNYAKYKEKLEKLEKESDTVQGFGRRFHLEEREKDDKEEIGFDFNLYEQKETLSVPGKAENIEIEVLVGKAEIEGTYIKPEGEVVLRYRERHESTNDYKSDIIFVYSGKWISHRLHNVIEEGENNHGK